MFERVINPRPPGGATSKRYLDPCNHLMPEMSAGIVKNAEGNIWTLTGNTCRRLEIKM